MRCPMCHPKLSALESLLSARAKIGDGIAVGAGLRWMVDAYDQDAKLSSTARCFLIGDADRWIHAYLVD
jgi:hypothetical protein